MYCKIFAPKLLEKKTCNTGDAYQRLRQRSELVCSCWVKALLMEELLVLREQEQRPEDTEIRGSRTRTHRYTQSSLYRPTYVTHFTHCSVLGFSVSFAESWGKNTFFKSKKNRPTNTNERKVCANVSPWATLWVNPELIKTYNYIILVSLMSFWLNVVAVQPHWLVTSLQPLFFLFYWPIMSKHNV